MARPKLSRDARALARVDALSCKLALEALSIGPSDERQMLRFYADTLASFVEMARSAGPDETLARSPSRLGNKGMILAVVPTRAKPGPSLRVIQGGRS